MDRLDDRVLVAEAARGEVKALAALYDRYASLMLGVARKIVGEVESAEDVVHDVFMELWRSAGSYDPERGSVRTWIFVRLRSRALDRVRSAKIRRELRRMVPKATDDGRVASELQLAPDARVLKTALDTLPEDQRRVLELAYFEGLSSTEIADRMGSPVGTVKSRTAAAIGKLRSAMRDGPPHKDDRVGGLGGEA